MPHTVARAFAKPSGSRVHVAVGRYVPYAVVHALTVAQRRIVYIAIVGYMPYHISVVSGRRLIEYFACHRFTPPIVFYAPSPILSIRRIP